MIFLHNQGRIYIQNTSNQLFRTHESLILGRNLFLRKGAPDEKIELTNGKADASSFLFFDSTIDFIKLVRNYVSIMVG